MPLRGMALDKADWGIVKGLTRLERRDGYWRVHSNPIKSSTTSQRTGERNPLCEQPIVAQNPTLLNETVCLDEDRLGLC